MHNSTSKKKRWLADVKRDTPFYLLLLPAVVLVFVFSYMPMMGILMAFKDVQVYGTLFEYPWAANHGFAHFIKIFQEKELYGAIWNTLKLNFLALLISFPAPIIFALLLNEIMNKAFKRTVQTISYLPHFISWISVTGLVTIMFSEYGNINDILAGLGLGRIGFLKNPDNFIVFYLGLTVWKTMGFSSILFLASMANISPDLYEAAIMDSANRFQRVIHITLPGILPTTMIMLILQMGQMFGSNFDLVFGLQSHRFDTEVISTVVYKIGMGYDSDYGLSTAISLMQSVVAIILTMGANMISKRVTKVSLW